MNTKILGDKGEGIAAIFLEKKGFVVLDRKYRRVWGEIDIIAEKQRAVHFFEVKSIVVSDISDESGPHRPEDNVHGLKIKHIRRMVETYLEEKDRGLDAEFYFHVLCVYINLKTRSARVKWIKNIIL